MGIQIQIGTLTLLLVIYVQTRTPSNLPTVLIVNSCIREDSEFAYWQKEVDLSSSIDGARSLGTKVGSMPNNASDAWLPFRISISVDTQSSRVKVTEVAIV